MLMSFLINTTMGDRICALIECLAGCALVPLDDLDCRAIATDRGRAAATNGDPGHLVGEEVQSAD